MEKVHVRFLRYSAFYTPLLLTLEGDELRKEGLVATYDRVTPEQSVEQGFREGTVQVAQSAPAVSFAPALRGEAPDYRHFALLNRRDGFFLAGRPQEPGPFTWRSLEGRSVLVDHFFQPMALFRTALRLQGVDETKVRFLDAGDVASIEAAFRRGEGDFVHLQGPAPQQLEADGVGRVVASVGQATGDLAFSSLCAQPAWLGTDVARAFVRAYRRERQAAQSHPAHDLAKRIGRYLPESDPGVLAKTIADYQRMETWAGSEVITPELFNATVEVFLAVGHMAAKPALADVLAPLPTV